MISLSVVSIFHIIDRSLGAFLTVILRPRSLWPKDPAPPSTLNPSGPSLFVILRPVIYRPKDPASPSALDPSEPPVLQDDKRAAPRYEGGTPSLRYGDPDRVDKPFILQALDAFQRPVAERKEIEVGFGNEVVSL